MRFLFYFYLVKKNIEMKAVTVKKIKDELSHRSANDLMELCLHLSKFKKENKELLTYLLLNLIMKRGILKV